jgi:hypothetical protein
LEPVPVPPEADSCGNTKRISDPDWIAADPVIEVPEDAIDDALSKGGFAVAFRHVPELPYSSNNNVNDIFRSVWETSL